MLKKRIFALLMTLVLTFTCIGCGNNNVTTDSKGASEGGKVILTMWYENRSIDDDIIAEVNKQFPNVELKAEKIGGDYLAKLITTLGSGTGMPDILYFNDWLPDLIPNADKFVNLLEAPCDANSIKDNYYPWKWDMALTSDKKTLIALPIDIGPCALFYRADLFEAAGLPSEPDKVSEMLKTWDDYFAAAKKIGEKTKAKMFDNQNRLFVYAMSQKELLYFDRDGKFIGDQKHVKDAFDLTVKAYKEGLMYGVPNWTPEWNASINNGDVASFVGAVWMKKVLKDAAPDTAGKWRVAAMPGGPGNNGGSFIGISKTSKHVEEAWQAIKWMMSTENQTRQFKSMDLFPSTPGAFKDESIFRKEDFFGGQETDRVFAKAADDMPIFYNAPKTQTMQDIFCEELELVVNQNKDPEKAWNDAVDKCNKEISR